MSKQKKYAGETSVSLAVFIQDTSSTTGGGLSGVTSASSGLVMEYRRQGSSSWTSVTPVSKTLGTYTSGGIVADGALAGAYEVDFPDAAFAAGAKFVLCRIRGVTNMLPALIEVELDAVNYQDATRFGLTALPNAVAGASGGLPTVDSSNRVKANTEQIAGQATSASAPVAFPASVANDATVAKDSTVAKETTVNSVLTAIQNLNNLSAKMNVYGTPLMEIPDSGTTTYAFTVVVRDDEDKLVALDASPTIAAANAAGTSRSANLSAVSNPSTGRYTFTYSVASTHPAENLRITISGAVSGEARYVEWIGSVVDYETITTLLAIKAKTDNLPANPAAVSDIPTANQNRDAVWNASSTVTYVDGSMGDRILISSNNTREVQVNGNGHVAAVIHDAEPNAIPEDAFQTGALSARVLAADAIDEDAIAASAVTKITVNLFKYGDVQRWNSPANQIDVTITKV